MIWDELGDVQIGRPHLGPNTTVVYYRLMQLSLRKELAARFGDEQADQMLKASGERAGRLVYESFLSDCGTLPALVRELTHFLKEHNVGILRVEEADEESRRFVFTVQEDLDCSGTAERTESSSASSMRVSWLGSWVASSTARSRWMRWSAGARAKPFAGLRPGPRSLPWISNSRGNVRLREARCELQGLREPSWRQPCDASRRATRRWS